MSVASSQGPSYDETVTGWADHLCSGGTTTWPAWLAQDHPPTEPTRPLPDAVHLELVRRLNVAAGGRATGALADRVLSIASPGRGLVDIPLPWPGGPRPYGSPAVEPDRLPEEELIRLAAGVLVHLLPGMPTAEAPSETPPWPLPWRRRFRLHGSPGTVTAVRAALLAQGLVETDWRPTHVVIARPVEVMMAEHWAANARAGGILKWATLWRRAQASGALPPQIDVAAIARRLEGRPREPVHVVVARDAQEAGETTARLLHARPEVLGGTGDLSETDLLRRINRLTALTLGPAQVRDVAARLVAALEEAPGKPVAGPPPAVPRAARAWAREQAAATARNLRPAGYAVHGTPDELVPADHSHSGTVDRTRTLDLALAACLETWRLQGGTP
jgi:hypothetical protein